MSAWLQKELKFAPEQVTQAKSQPAKKVVWADQEVMQPGTALVRRILERGIARGEIRPLDLGTGVYLVLAPMMFLMFWQNSMAWCLPARAVQEADSGCAVMPFSPEAYLEAQVDNLVRGLTLRA